MKSLLHTLDLESVLLMYLFEELPPDDRAELETMLANNAGLRSQLERLRAASAATDEAIARADRDTDKRTRSIQLAQRNAAKLIGRWNVRKIMEAPVPRRTSGFRKWVLYPAGAVAAVLMLGLILWGIFGEPPNVDMRSDAPGLEEAQREQLAEMEKAWDDGQLSPEEMRAEDAAVAAAMASVLADPEIGETIVRSFDTSEELLQETQFHRYLNEAERHLGVLARLGDETEGLQ